MEGIEQGVLVVLSVSLCCVAALADFIATLNPLLGKARTSKGVRGDHYMWIHYTFSISTPDSKEPRLQRTGTRGPGYILYNDHQRQRPSCPTSKPTSLKSIPPPTQCRTQS